MPEPIGSEAGYRRPVVVVQGDRLNRSRVDTVVCVPLTSELKWKNGPGNVLLKMSTTGLLKDSVANVSLVVALDRELLEEPVGQLSRPKIDELLAGIDIILGR